MNIVVFDTETTSIEKPFCYNIGYVIYDTETQTTLLKREYVVEQVWHNPMLFTTAYYADKKAIYIERMRARKIPLEKYGYVTQQMARDFKAYEVKYAYCYTPFDIRVFTYNCDWFKCINPFDNIPIYDIRGFVHHSIAKEEAFLTFCEENALFTECGHYSTTAETLFKYITNNLDFMEEHTALADAEIELKILTACVNNAEYPLSYEKDYKAKTSIYRNIERTLTIVDTEGVTHNFPYIKKLNKNKDKIFLKK